MEDKRNASDPQKSSYRDILHSTALIGASSIVSMFVSLIRMKAFAVLLGPGGVGLVALFSALADVVVAIAGLGVSSSGVRQIAQAEGTGDRTRVARTMDVVARTSLVLGFAGGLGLAVLAIPASVLTFGSPEYAMSVAVLGTVVLLRIVTGGETALLQGTRRILDLAKLNIISAIAGVAVSVPVVFVWREAAVVPGLVLMALVTWIAARWYSRRAVGLGAAGPIPTSKHDTRDLLRLGAAFMISGFLTLGAAYLVRIIILQGEGVAAAGLYQAAWALSGLFVGVVLQAMGTDFYPRLTAAADDNATVTRLVGEQIQVSLLIAGPGVVGTMALSHIAVNAFYSVEFSAAAETLRWLCLGMMFRVVSWPMGYIIVAKGWQKTFVALEALAAILHVGFAALLVPVLGINGSGIAFTLLYVSHGLIVYLVVHRNCGFRLRPEHATMIALFGVACGASLIAFAVLSIWWATAVGVLITCITGIVCLYQLMSVAPELLASPKLPSWLRSRIAKA